MRAAAGQDEETRRRRPTEPYKTHLAYVRERRSDADGDALLEEALTRLHQRRGGVARPLPPVIAAARTGMDAVCQVAVRSPVLRRRPDPPRPSARAGVAVVGGVWWSAWRHCPAAIPSGTVPAVAGRDPARRDPAQRGSGSAELAVATSQYSDAGGRRREKCHGSGRGNSPTGAGRPGRPGARGAAGRPRSAWLL